MLGSISVSGGQCIAFLCFAVWQYSYILQWHVPFAEFHLKDPILQCL